MNPKKRRRRPSNFDCIDADGLVRVLKIGAVALDVNGLDDIITACRYYYYVLYP